VDQPLTGFAWAVAQRFLRTGGVELEEQETDVLAQSMVVVKRRSRQRQAVAGRA